MSAPKVHLPEAMNAAAMLVDENVEAGREHKVAIRYVGDGSRHTYGDVLRMTNRVGHGLRALGVRMEERVMLLLPDSPEFVFCFFGAMKIGAVPIPTNTLLTPGDYEYMLSDSRARTLVVHETLWERIAPIRARLRHLKDVVVVGAQDHGQIPFGSLVSEGSEELSPELMSPDDVCLWLYSSGTTGFPKGAVHMHRSMIVSADLYARPTLSLTEVDRTFSVAKLFFAYGLGNGLYFPFRVGATTILNPGKPDPAACFEIIEEHRPTVFFSVPTAYAAMLALEDAETRYDTSSLRLCVSAGEALPPALFTRFKDRFGVEILDGIGSTEIIHIFISNRAGRVKPGSTGEVVPGYEARIVDAEGMTLPPGEIGDLLIKGDSICSRYWNKHEKTRETIEGEWIRTGDKYKFDEEGYLWYQGRTDDMLKVGGMWVSPIEIENALVEHPAVLESAVVGRTDEADLVKPKAFVVLRTGEAPSEDLAGELKAFVKERIGVYKFPRWIQFVDDLPKTATGKTQRYKLRE